MQKKVTTSLLNIAYEEYGNENSPVIVLLHGFPDDANTWNAVCGRLVEKGFRTLAPYHRGYGATGFKSDKTIRSGQYTALVTDILNFTDALKIDRFLLVGHDWGATVAHEIAALYPGKVKALVTIASSYNGTGQQKLFLQLIQAYWYQWYFNTQLGYTELAEKRKEFCRRLWQVWSPTWNFDEREFDTTATSWENPDFVDIVIHSYRYRWKNAPGDPQYEGIELQLKQKPEIDVPVIFLQGDKDGASLPESSLNKEHFFTNHYERRIIENAGHFIQRENPEAVIKAILDVNSISDRQSPK